MQIIADFHIHGPTSGGSSKNMQFTGLALNAAIKGVDVVVTGDFTQPDWLQNIRENLEYDEDSGLFKLQYDLAAKQNQGKASRTRFILGTEVNCTFNSPFEGEKRKKQIHHGILVGSMEVAEQLIEEFQPFGKLDRVGRPTLHLSAAELVEIVKRVDKNNIIFAAHIWTPHYSLFGANSGFDSAKDCYGDKLNKLDALETGLSSDPLMNWRVSSLDQFTLISNSDAHSSAPWRLGREANLFDLSQLTYEELVDAIRHPDKGKFKQTIEFPPSLGKYHWTGHRKCEVCLSPTNAMQIMNCCPSCGKLLTIGVGQRVESLSDRKHPKKPKGAPDFIYLVPLHEVIAFALNIKTLSSKTINNEYDKLISKFNSEYTVMFEINFKNLRETTNELIAKSIYAIRYGKYQIKPGFDNQYGQLHLYLNKVTGLETNPDYQLHSNSFSTRGKQSDLKNYFG